MKLTGINQNCTFKALFIHPYKRDYAIDFIKKYEDVIGNVSKEKDIVISTEDKIIEEGTDFVITKPIINVAIHPKTILRKNGAKIDKKYNTVMNTAFSYIPSTVNEKDEKFADVLQNTLSLIG